MFTCTYRQGNTVDIKEKDKSDRNLIKNEEHIEDRRISKKGEKEREQQQVRLFVWN